MDARICDILRSWQHDECWRRAAGWDGYEVSSFGAVRGKRGVLMPAVVHGYERLSLSAGGVVRNCTVHRLVLETFVGPPPFEGAIVAHNDGNRRNNNIANLRWASALENQADRKRHNSIRRGSSVTWSKLTEEDIPIIRQRALSGEPYKDIAASFGISISTVSLVKLGRVWKHASGAAWGIKS